MQTDGNLVTRRWRNLPAGIWALGFVSMLMDVSSEMIHALLPVSSANDQIDRVAATMNRHLERLSDLMLSTKSSAAAIAHDLKRPLARAVLGVERALDHQAEGKNTQVDLEESRDELMKLNRIFETILRIARIDAGQGVTQAQTVDLSELVRDLGETYQVVAEESGQSMRVEAAAGIEIPGDAGMVSQMLANLLQNAITHGGAGNRISLSLTEQEGKAVLEVADTGPGINVADRARVLEPFFRSDAARTTEGSGLGLALVKSIADRHGAELSLGDNEPGLLVRLEFATRI